MMYYKTDGHWCRLLSEFYLNGAINVFNCPSHTRTIPTSNTQIGSYSMVMLGGGAMQDAAGYTNGVRNWRGTHPVAKGASVKIRAVAATGELGDVAHEANLDNNYIIESDGGYYMGLKTAGMGGRMTPRHSGGLWLNYIAVDLSVRSVKLPRDSYIYYTQSDTASCWYRTYDTSTDWPYQSASVFSPGFYEY